MEKHQMEIKVFKKNVFGKDLIYPYNLTANKLVYLLGKKTFDAENLRILEGIGFTVIDLTLSE
jgi:hypothetical protein